VRRWASWDLYRLQWEDIPNDSLLDMKVVGVDPKVPDVRSVRRPKKNEDTDMPAEIFLGDPYDHGRAAASAVAPPAVPAGSSREDDGDAAGPGDPELGGDGDMVGDPFAGDDAEIVQGLPDLDIADMQDMMVEAYGLDPDGDGELLTVGEEVGPDVDEGAADPEADAAVEEEAIAVALADGSGPHAIALEAPTPQQCVSASLMSSAGYVTCTLPGWAIGPSIGRITTWGKQPQLSDRSVSCRCYLHPKCVTPAKRRWQIDDQRLLLWLFSAVHEPDATKARKNELGTLHRSLFKNIFEGPGSGPHPGPGGAASSSGAAASSSGAA